MFSEIWESHDSFNKWAKPMEKHCKTIQAVIDHYVPVQMWIYPNTSCLIQNICGVYIWFLEGRHAERVSTGASAPVLMISCSTMSQQFIWSTRESFFQTINSRPHGSAPGCDQTGARYRLLTGQLDYADRRGMRTESVSAFSDKEAHAENGKALGALTGSLFDGC